MIPRKAVDGIVRDPLSGAIEFTSTDQAMAEAYAAEMDQLQPVMVRRIYELLDAMHPKDRMHAEWVMPGEVRRTLRIENAGGVPLWGVPQSFDGPELLLGLPVVVDDEAAGVTLRTKKADA